jgi:hypothetical protein
MPAATKISTATTRSYGSLWPGCTCEIVIAASAIAQLKTQAGSRHRFSTV